MMMRNASRQTGSIIGVILLSLCLMSIGANCDAGVAAKSALFDAKTGFRIAKYRAPTPERAPGAQRISLKDLQALIGSSKTILLDVRPAKGGRLDETTGKWQLSKAMKTIPGSVWLPNVGYGVLTPTISAYFRDNLVRLTGGDRMAKLVMFCRSDCWMSWNAAKRAAEWGYGAVYWFAEGVDDWVQAGLPLVNADPTPVR